MATYYYLLSSLPDLYVDEELPITYEEFVNLCEGNVSDKKFELLRDLTLESSEGPVLNKWSKFYLTLTREINAQRSVALGKSYQVEYDKDPVSTLIAQAALSAKNPLEGEKLLLEHEFEALDHYIGGHFYDDVCLFGYAIKLKLLERQSCFVKSKGQAEFKRLFDNVQERVYNL